MISHIKVVDVIMSGGKSQWAKEFIKNQKLPVIYVTPYLEEVERFKDCYGKKLYEPIYNGKSKKDNIKYLISKGINICTTHSLFSSFDEDILELIKLNHYILILDEVVSGYTVYPITHQDYNMLKEKQYIYVNDITKQIHLNPTKEYVKNDLYYKGVFSDFIDYVENCKVYEHRNVPIIEFPINIFDYFTVVFILTYMFDGSTLKSSFQINDIKYNRINIPPTKEYHPFDVLYEENICNFSGIKFKNKIKIINDTKINKFDEFKIGVFSSSWYKKYGNGYGKIIGDVTRNYFKHRNKLKCKDVLYTVYKDQEKNVKVLSYAKSFVPVNLRATNKYSDRSCGAYLVNRYLNPILKSFIKSKGGTIHEDIYALSEMLQWIWRLRIRNGEDISLFIPSKRMRNLLIKWLNGEKIISDDEFYENNTNYKNKKKLTD